MSLLLIFEISLSDVRITVSSAYWIIIDLDDSIRERGQWGIKILSCSIIYILFDSLSAQFVITVSSLISPT